MSLRRLPVQRLLQPLPLPTPPLSPSLQPIRRRCRLQAFPMRASVSYRSRSERGTLCQPLHLMRRLETLYPTNIIGSSTGPNGQIDDNHLRIFSAGPESSPSRQLARAVYWIDFTMTPDMIIELQERGFSK